MGIFFRGLEYPKKKPLLRSNNLRLKNFNLSLFKNFSQFKKIRQIWVELLPKGGLSQAGRLSPRAPSEHGPKKLSPLRGQAVSRVTSWPAHSFFVLRDYLPAGPPIRPETRQNLPIISNGKIGNRVSGQVRRHLDPKLLNSRQINYRSIV